MNIFIVYCLLIAFIVCAGILLQRTINSPPPMRKYIVCYDIGAGGSIVARGYIIIDTRRINEKTIAEIRDHVRMNQSKDEKVVITGIMEIDQ